MSLRMLDGFDTYPSGNGSRLLARWTSTTTDTYQRVGQDPGRFGGFCLRTLLSVSEIRKSFDNQPTWIVGFAFQPVTNSPTGVVLCNFLDSGATQVDLRWYNDGSIGVTRNGTALTGGRTPLGLVTPNAWNFVEWKVTISNSIAANSCIIRINGVQQAAVAAGQNTRTGANSYANQFGLNGDGMNPGWMFDDLYICDGTGAGPDNDFLGEGRIDTLVPNGNGDTSQFLGSDGDSVNNYLLATTNDGDTSYTGSSTPGQVDLYHLQDLATIPQAVKAVQTVIVARKDDAGARELAARLRIGGVDYDATARQLSATYLHYLDIFVNSPATGIPWTGAEVNGLQLGPKVQA